MVRLYHLERVSFRDGVDEEEALAVEHIVLPHRTVRSQNNPTIVKEAKRQLPQNRADRRTKMGQRSGVTSQLACRRAGFNNNYKSFFQPKKKWTCLNSSWPAVSSTSMRVSSPSIKHSFRY